MLRVENLTVLYGRLSALRDVSVEVNTGEIVTVIGSNGSGKTTLLNAVAGLLPIARGSIWLDGREVTGLPVHQSVRMGIGYVPEGRALFGPLSVIDNLALGAYSSRPMRGWNAIKDVRMCLRDATLTARLEHVFSLFPILRERQSQAAGSLSGGQQQMVAIGRALMSAPRVLVLDEPSLGLAPNLVREILHLLVRLKGEGLAVLLVEQDAYASLKISDRGYVMNRGRITIQGTADELLNNDKVRQAYLGKTIT